MSEQSYLNILHELRHKAPRSSNRTGVDTVSVFGRQIRFDLQEGFPLLTTKKVSLRFVAEELFWFLRGETNISTLKCSIWDEWATETGDLGPIYGEQWVNWLDRDGKGQLDRLVEGLRVRPNSRRHILSAWNVADLSDEGLSPQENVELNRMALAPCHVMSQYTVRDGRLSCMLTQRSADWFLGAPYNIASYALLTHLLAKVCGYEVGELVYSLGDVHLYVNHFDVADEQLSRAWKARPVPWLRIEGVKKLREYEWGDVVLEGYDPHPAIKAEVAI